MKTVMKKAIRDEKGAGVLALVLVLLVVGGLILTPLLGLMSTGLLAGQAYERHTDRLYAADAGVEDAIWKIQTNNLAFDPATNWSQPWHITANGKNVTVVAYRYDWDWTCAENLTYQILSTAATDDGGGTADIGSSTTVDAHLVASYLNLSPLLDYAIVSNSTIDIQPNNKINGDVWLPDESKLSDPKEAINGTIYDSSEVSVTWPDAQYLRSYYWNWVKNLTPSINDQIDILAVTSESNPHVIGPLSSDPEGGTLTVKGDGWIKLGGTVYVKGNLVFNPKPNIALNLSHETIFVEGSISIGPKVTLTGSGCIIAVGDVDFQPSISSGGGDFVLVMSIGGKTTLLPNGSFTGCVAGKDVVRLQPAQGQEFSINWIDPEGKDLDIPWGAFDINKLPLVTGLRIESWEINPQ